MANNTKIKRKSKTTKEVVTTASITTLGILAADNIPSKKNKKELFGSFKDVQKHYSSAKFGDTIFFKDPSSSMNLHPITVMDNENHYDWPTQEGKAKGLREKKVTDFSVKDPDRPYRARGKYTELQPGKNPVVFGSLEAKLHETSHVINKKGVNVFSPQGASRIGGIYEYPNLDKKELASKLVDIEKNKNNGKFKYKPLGTKFTRCGGTGNCITYTDSILSSVKNKNVVSNLPAQLEAKLNLIKKSKNLPISKFNLISPILAIDGINRFREGRKAGDTNKQVLGAVEATAGFGIQSNKALKSFTNIPLTAGAELVGSYADYAREVITNKIKKTSVPKMDTYLLNVIKQKPKRLRNVGAALLAVPVAYGVKKGMDKIAKKKSDKLNNYDYAGRALIGTAATLGVVPAARYLHQRKVDPNLIEVRGGTTNSLVKPGEGATRYHTVFDTQRKAYAQAFRSKGVAVNEKAQIVTHKGPMVTINKKTSGMPITKEFPIGRQTKGKPLVTLDIGNYPGAELKAKYHKYIKGKPIYRVFSDLGPGNQQQPRFDAGMKNMMFASSSDAYTRNVVPGGKAVKGAVQAERSNINITSVANTIKGKLSKPAAKKSPLVSLSFGSGYGWQDSKFPHRDENIKNIVKGLDTSYGEGKYRLAILGGPNINKDYEKHFQELSKQKSNVFYGKGTKTKGVLNLLGKSDVAIMAPGSVASDLQAMKGTKPKVLAFNPEASSGTSAHFKHNINWLKSIGKESVEPVDFTRKGAVSSDVIAAKVDKLRKAPAHTTKVNFGGKDIKRILARAQTDLKDYKVLTKKLTRRSVAGLAIGGTILGVNKYYKDIK